MQGRLPGEDGPAHAAWTEFRRWARGPVGCLFSILCLPFALLALAAMFAVALWKTWRLRRDLLRVMAAAEDAAEAEPVLRLVRAMAIDESFTREEAAQAGVAASAGRSPADLLDEAVRRGWVETRPDGRMAVTERGRAAVA
jgi:hypothetical protein